MSNSGRTALVAVDIVYSADIPYSYNIPPELSGELTEGDIIRVPFGKSNKNVDALVLDVSEQEETGLKEISCFTGDRLDNEELRLVKYIKNRYFCTYFDALKLVRPSFGGKKSSPLYERNIQLINSGFLNECIDENGNIKKKYEKQMRVVRYLKKNGCSPLNIVVFETAVSASVISTLERNGIVESVMIQKNRSPVRALVQRGERPENLLNEEQEKAFNDIMSDLGSGKTRLLYGVTGSGKTHVFISLIDEVLSRGQTALMMIPEISLTFQVIERFYSYYGNSLAIIHSGLSAGEKNDEWQRIMDGEAKVVVGTRSAVFAPLKNLGIIIIDEEQEHTYKSEMTPKYNTREIASFRAVQQKALLLLASATPSFESFYRAQNRIIGYSELSNRFNGQPLPKVITSDLQREVMDGNNNIVGRFLAGEIEKNLKNGEQTILFMNRRGYNSYVACPKCGSVLKCPNCGIPLTFHIDGNKLLCHYCSYVQDARTDCTSCGSQTMRYTGVGTQKAEEQLLSLFPGIRVLRMDADTVTAKNSRDEILSSFARGEYDVLLGTQMITKGLDFPNVTLVGVLNADSMLYSSDFRAYERTFSLITQVIGRAGRSEKSGRAVVQTYSPSHDVLRFAFEQDYKGFFENQMPLRRTLFYPPFCDVCQAVFIGKTERDVLSAADGFITIIKELTSDKKFEDVGVRIIRPRITFVPMVDGKSRSRIIIKCKDNVKTREMIRHTLLRFQKEKEYKDISASLDMNPMNIL